ncbi:hypothetical protein GCM10011491_31040 [Brucella endophytica]|uniref:Uncharacterized protein n=1 Tax=Brucella endophytica TaxID=1963359 RepID=A0A916WHL1_9HYPH|nr:hypothetical protein [Brucella endophytica]GGB00639.1 hypothetical protein GCM10011491_31040 [Brucella endophytica]
MDKAIEAVLTAIGNNPWLIALFAIFVLLLHYGPAYITAISNALSQRRRDDVELLEKEAKLKAKLLALKEKEKDNA